MAAGGWPPPASPVPGELAGVRRLLVLMLVSLVQWGAREVSQSWLFGRDAAGGGTAAPTVDPID